MDESAVTFSPEMEARITAYEAKRQARVDRLRDRARAANREAQQQYTLWDQQSSVIPFGQPILVGHHSESRDRRFRARLHRILERSQERRDAAQHLEARAQAAESNRAIFSDDPLATMKLKEKIRHLAARQAAMKRINAVCHKLKLRKGEPETADRLRRAVDTGQLSAPDVEALEQACRYGWRDKIAFPAYMLSNNNANIRRLRERITHLERQASNVAEDQVINGVRIVDNVEANRLQMFFPGKPSEAIRKELKSAGFRRSPSEGAWQRHRSSSATYWAQRIAQKLS